jgi:hypothetical protein
VRHFYGKYRGKVEQNQDTLQLGRVQVSCPAVLGTGRFTWAMPCSPYAGPGVGFFAIPPTGAQVWVEFEGGDPDKAIWSGCFWGVGEVPALPALPSTKVLKTDSLTLKLDDLPLVGGFTLEVGQKTTGIALKITCDAKGMELSAGPKSKVTLSPYDVTINDDGLKVI